MKATTIALCSLLVVSASAAPLDAHHEHKVTVALSNDHSGAYTGVTIPADHTDRSITSLFGETAVGSEGTVYASSAQLTAFPQTISCVLARYGTPIATLTAQHTFADLDGNPGASTPVNLHDAVINCHV
ncbi:hypothetical protein NUU61_002443 [Penicillium alfredii]|uniref:Uncharacterized protein n=1 Tax=Penicillium alfredii TaxID=1506179 RepID=A0A9W9FRI0_9EURO|nr:uncharacterized protein NUU61_002443 [Penicillium alfredii]KAJ5105096.1 hypothetical protein NUU61_002443 [Penicillium alfredii]